MNTVYINTVSRKFTMLPFVLVFIITLFCIIYSLFFLMMLIELMPVFITCVFPLTVELNSNF